MTHPLTPLLAPRSIAFVGASPREGTLGHDMLRVVRRGGFNGAIHPINPKYESIEGLPCLPSLAALPGPVDHVVLAVANARLEASLDEAIAAGAHSATIFASGYLENDVEPALLARLAAKARAARLPVCGGNCMGFYNLDQGTRICGFYTERDPVPGGIAFITHSGSVFSAMAHNDRRLGYNLVVSSGQEITTTAADYLDYALDQPSTRVVGLFLETVRDVPGFLTALAKARALRIPVVVLKAGATAESARLAASHSGAIAGDDAAYEAVFDRHGVIRVATLDELMATLLLLAQPRRAGAGGVAAMLDSGGERGMLIDLAARQGVPFAAIGADTRARLAARLDYGLEPVNPLDAWGTGNDYEGVFRDCFQALAEDPDTAAAVIFANIRDSGFLAGPYERVLRNAHDKVDKPIVIATNFSRCVHDQVAARLTGASIPVLDGTQNALAALGHLFALRDVWARPEPIPPAPPAETVVVSWRERLAYGGTLDEVEGLALLEAFGVPTTRPMVVERPEAALAAAEQMGFPVALKTAKPGVLHKSDVDGVRLNLVDGHALVAAYVDIAEHLGRRMIVAPMARPGVEMTFGMVRDAQFGPIVMIGAGGTLIEVLRDRVVAVPPFDAAMARRLIDRLAIRRVLAGVRGRPAAHIDRLAEAFARFSVLAASLGRSIAELDVNPVIATSAGVTAVDALVVAQPRGR
ncbi:MAG: acetate--CoA ligase family protein [Alphaproteobacteria bacterium]|nr:acetate--CoA ligase family protein [Alphaproteobacteria bacterium]